MFSSFDPKWIDELRTHIETLERASLESMTPDKFALTDVFDEREHTFYSIQGLANFWNNNPNIDFGQHITDLVIGAHNQLQSELVLVIAGTARKLSVYISLGNAATLSLIEGILPGIHIEPVPVKNLARYLHPHFQAQGIITGIPSNKATKAGSPASLNDDAGSPGLSTNSMSSTPDTPGESQLERVVRGMYRATWVYVVKAHPRSRYAVAQDRLDTLDLLARIASQSRIQLQITEQDSKQKSEIETGSHTQTFSGEMVNYRAQYLVRLLERELERLDQAAASGQWIVQTCFGASTVSDAQRLASLLVGALAGKDSRPNPLRAFICRDGQTSLSIFTTYLSSDEVATLIQLPREEVPGYAISDFVRFDVDFRFSNHTTQAPLALGHIQHNGQDADPYQINLDDLAKHGVVVGVTGSGKTTTMMNLLARVLDAGKPFLVIEPAKTEYRALRSTLSGKADVRIYTLGNENIAPFRLNPFEFETDTTPGSASVVNHIDFLKAVFNAAFILYAPMPYILETALHEIYEDKGWDLATGINTRLPKWGERHRYPIFPTLADLYRKVEAVVDRLGYDTRIEQDVKAGLKARIGSMRIGSKGQMLDTARGISMQQLLSYPTILEMEHIGGDDEKTFIMGMLLTKLYEYRRLQAASGSLKPGLQHVLVFEEAHRLLKNTETQVDTESSNMRAQAIEVFTNMLSEVRAYGQGVLVAEQIPAKLAPDVLKNTNLKIAHRLVAQDDRMSVGQSMNLNVEQMNHLGTLAAGMAAIYAEGADHAYKVRLDNYKHALTPLTDAQLKAESPKYISLENCQAILDFNRYGIPRTVFGSPDALLSQHTSRLLDSERGRWLWSQTILRIVFSRAQMPEALKMLKQHIVHEITSLQVKQEALLRMLIVQGCAELLYRQGATFGLPYPVVEELRVFLTQGMVAYLQTKDITLANSDLDRFARRYELPFVQSQGPFAGCLHCRQICQYRSHARDLLLPPDRGWIIGELENTAHKTNADRYNMIGMLAKDIAERWLGEKNFVVPDLAYCASLHVVSNADFTEYEQKQFGDQLSAALLK